MKRLDFVRAGAFALIAPQFLFKRSAEKAIIANTLPNELFPDTDKLVQSLTGFPVAKIKTVHFSDYSIVQIDNVRYKVIKLPLYIHD